jgi:hypothetical protein
MCHAIPTFNHTDLRIPQPGLDKAINGLLHAAHKPGVQKSRAPGRLGD